MLAVRRIPNPRSEVRAKVHGELLSFIALLKNKELVPHQWIVNKKKTQEHGRGHEGKGRTGKG